MLGWLICFTMNINSDIFINIIKQCQLRILVYLIWISCIGQGQIISYYPWLPTPLGLTSNLQAPPPPPPPPHPPPSPPIIPGSYTATSIKCGGIVSVSTGSSTYIVSPRYPETYPPNVQCKWEIKAPLGSRIALYFENLVLPTNDVACNGDRLEIIDLHHTQRYCYYQFGGTYVSVAPSISVLFTSDRIREDFPARFRIRLETNRNWCGGDLSDRKGEISSPNYPQLYSPNVVCGWKIQGPIRSQIRLRCPSVFWLEPSDDCTNDFLAISISGDESMKASSRYCGFNGPGTMMSDGNIMTVLFHSNMQFVFTGFRCQYEIIEPSEGFRYQSVASSLQSGISPNSLAFTTVYPSLFGPTLPQLFPAASSVVYSQPCDCGRANKKSVREARIVGGTQTQINAYPWVVAIFKRDGRQYCAGSLINELFILTASHCVARLNPSDIYVSLGDHDLDILEEARSSVVKLRRIIVHPGYRSTPVETDDIALLELAQPILLSSTVRPICLPPPELDIRGQTPTVIGWGKLSEAGLSTSVLRETALPIQSNTECQRAYGYSVVTENMICAGQLDGTRDACQGDSGGPMMVIRHVGDERREEGGRYYMIGLVSYGFGCARPEFPGVYTRIDRYLDWIRINTESSNVCSSVPRSTISPSSLSTSQSTLQNRLVHRYGWKWNFKRSPNTDIEMERTSEADFGTEGNKDWNYTMDHG